MHNVSSLKIKSAIFLVMCSKSSSLIDPFKKYSILIGKGPFKPRILLRLVSYVSSPTSFPGLIPWNTICKEKALKATIPGKRLAPLPTFTIFVRGFISSSPISSSMLFIAMKLSLLVYNIAVGEGGVPILVIPLGIVPKTPYQRVRVLSNLGVPRTFVVDCKVQLHTLSLIFQLALSSAKFL